MSAAALGLGVGDAPADGKGEKGTEAVGSPLGGGRRLGGGVPWFDDGTHAAITAAPAAIATPRNWRRVIGGFGVGCGVTRG
ncbi:MAG: hypothetical protein QOI10_4704 [Solirubrobacterales bacterium]|jgi:hypothetical protein|nr:hypothetical protein [Solirubrobacterales bacterium]